VERHKVKQKISMDIEGKTRAGIDALVGIEDGVSSRGGVIDYLYTLFVDVPEPVMRDLFAFALRREQQCRLSRSADAEQEESEDFWENQSAEVVNTWYYIGNLFRRQLLKKGRHAAVNKIEDEVLSQLANDDKSEMTIHKLSSGQIAFPDDWRVLNPDCWSTAEYATVVEVRNGKGEWPHWVFLANNADERFDTDLINELIVHDYPKFQDALSKVVEPVFRKDDDLLPANLEEWQQSLEPGYFDISMGGTEYASQEYIDYISEHGTRRF